MILPDGRIVAAGSAHSAATFDDFAVARYLADGQLDASFSGDGRAVFDFHGFYDNASAIARGTDGSIMIAGTAALNEGFGSEDVALVRLLPDGSLDVGFSGGLVTVDFGDGTGMQSDAGQALLALDNGEVVAFGTAGHATGAGSADFALMHLTGDGTLRGAAGAGGAIRYDLDQGDSGFYDLELADAGKITATGGAYQEAEHGAGFAIARYDGSGELDPTWGAGGRVFTAFTGAGLSNAEARTVILQGDGKVLAAGKAATDSSGAEEFAAARYLPGGDPDPAFGDGGQVTLAAPDAAGTTGGAQDAVQLAGGDLVLAGAVGAGSGSDFAFARLMSNGRLNTAFDGDGWATLDFAGYSDAAWAATLDAEGRIVAAGEAGVSATSSNFGLARHNADGSPDTSFDGNGKLSTAFSGFAAIAYGVAVQDDGKIVAAGLAQAYSAGGDGVRMALARYMSDGSLDTTFDGDGRAMLALPAGPARLADLILQPDGKIVAAGAVVERRSQFLVARFIADGGLDEWFGDGGVATVDFAQRPSVAQGLLLDAEGRIVVAGSAGTVALARLLSTAAPQVDVAAEGQDVVLSWDMDEAARSCEVWSSPEPYFKPSTQPAELSGRISPCGPGALEFRDTGRLGNTESNHAYRVRIMDGKWAGTSDPVGEFEFPIMPAN